MVKRQVTTNSAPRVGPCHSDGTDAMRFDLLPLSHEQLRDVAASAIPRGLGPGFTAESLPPDFIGATALEQRALGKSSFWCGAFLIVRRVDQLVVGSCCFKDEPRDGRVEIGYGIATAFRRQGAAADAVSALRVLAAQGGAKEVLAEVSPANLPSTSLVRQLGFVDTGSRTDDDDGPVTCWVAEVTSRTTSMTPSRPARGTTDKDSLS